MSPFTKVYTQQSSSGGGLRQAGNSKQRSGQIRTGGMGRGLMPQKRTVSGSQGPMMMSGDPKSGVIQVRPNQSAASMNQ